MLLIRNHHSYTNTYAHNVKTLSCIQWFTPMWILFHSLSLFLYFHLYQLFSASFSFNLYTRVQQNFNEWLSEIMRASLRKKSLFYSVPSLLCILKIDYLANDFVLSATLWSQNSRQCSLFFRSSVYFKWFYIHLYAVNLNILYVSELFDGTASPYYVYIVVYYIHRTHTICTLNIVFNLI